MSQQGAKTMPKTEYVIEPGKQELTSTVVLDAPRELVFRAYTDPKLFAQWWGPRRYENKIEKFRSSGMDVSLSVSGLHDIKLHVAADCTRVTFDPGTYNTSSTVPRRSLQSRTVVPQSRADGCSTFVIRSSEHGLIPGCPTNFAKDGENFYHLYHVAALYELALITQERTQRKILCEFADRWLGYMQDPKHRSFGGKASFAEPSEFVRKIERFRALPNKLDFDQLRSRAAADT